MLAGFSFWYVLPRPSWKTKRKAPVEDEGGGGGGETRNVVTNLGTDNVFDGRVGTHGG